MYCHLFCIVKEHYPTPVIDQRKTLVHVCTSSSTTNYPSSTSSFQSGSSSSSTLGRNKGGRPKVSLADKEKFLKRARRISRKKVNELEMVMKKEEERERQKPAEKMVKMLTKILTRTPKDVIDLLESDMEEHRERARRLRVRMTGSDEEILPIDRYVVLERAQDIVRKAHVLKLRAKMSKSKKVEVKPAPSSDLDPQGSELAETAKPKDEPPPLPPRKNINLGASTKNSRPLPPIPAEPTETEDDEIEEMGEHTVFRTIKVPPEYYIADRNIYYQFKRYIRECAEQRNSFRLVRRHLKRVIERIEKPELRWVNLYYCLLQSRCQSLSDLIMRNYWFMLDSSPKVSDLARNVDPDLCYFFIKQERSIAEVGVTTEVLVAMMKEMQGIVIEDDDGLASQLQWHHFQLVIITHKLIDSIMEVMNFLNEVREELLHEVSECNRQISELFTLSETAKDVQYGCVEIMNRHDVEHQIWLHEDIEEEPKYEKKIEELPVRKEGNAEWLKYRITNANWLHQKDPFTKWYYPDAKLSRSSDSDTGKGNNVTDIQSMRPSWKDKIQKCLREKIEKWEDNLLKNKEIKRKRDLKWHYIKKKHERKKLRKKELCRVQLEKEVEKLEAEKKITVKVPGTVQNLLPETRDWPTDRAKRMKRRKVSAAMLEAIMSKHNLLIKHQEKMERKKRKVLKRRSKPNVCVCKRITGFASDTIWKGSILLDKQLRHLDNLVENFFRSLLRKRRRMPPQAQDPSTFIYNIVRVAEEEREERKLQKQLERLRAKQNKGWKLKGTDKIEFEDIGYLLVKKKLLSVKSWRNMRSAKLYLHRKKDKKFWNKVWLSSMLSIVEMSNEIARIDDEIQDLEMDIEHEQRTREEYTDLGKLLTMQTRIIALKKQKNKLLKRINKNKEKGCLQAFKRYTRLQKKNMSQDGEYSTAVSDSDDSSTDTLYDAPYVISDDSTEETEDENIQNNAENVMSEESTLRTYEELRHQHLDTSSEEGGYHQFRAEGVNVPKQKRPDALSRMIEKLTLNDFEPETFYLNFLEIFRSEVRVINLILDLKYENIDKETFAEQFVKVCDYDKKKEREVLETIKAFNYTKVPGLRTMRDCKTTLHKRSRRFRKFINKQSRKIKVMTEKVGSEIQTVAWKSERVLRKIPMPRGPMCMRRNPLEVRKKTQMCPCISRLHTKYQEYCWKKHVALSKEVRKLRKHALGTKQKEKCLVRWKKKSFKYLGACKQSVIATAKRLTSSKFCTKTVNCARHIKTRSSKKLAKVNEQRNTKRNQITSFISNAKDSEFARSVSRYIDSGKQACRTGKQHLSEWLHSAEKRVKSTRGAMSTKVKAAKSHVPACLSDQKQRTNKTQPILEESIGESTGEQPLSLTEGKTSHDRNLEIIEEMVLKSMKEDTKMAEVDSEIVNSLEKKENGKKSRQNIRKTRREKLKNIALARVHMNLEERSKRLMTGMAAITNLGEKASSVPQTFETNCKLIADHSEDDSILKQSGSDIDIYSTQSVTDRMFGWVEAGVGSSSSDDDTCVFKDTEKDKLTNYELSSSSTADVMLCQPTDKTLKVEVHRSMQDESKIVEDSRLEILSSALSAEIPERQKELCHTGPEFFNSQIANQGSTLRLDKTHLKDGVDVSTGKGETCSGDQVIEAYWKQLEVHGKQPNDDHVSQKSLKEQRESAEYTNNVHKTELHETEFRCHSNLSIMPKCRYSREFNKPHPQKCNEHRSFERTALKTEAINQTANVEEEKRLVKKVRFLNLPSLSSTETSNMALNGTGDISNSSNTIDDEISEILDSSNDQSKNDALRIRTCSVEQELAASTVNYFSHVDERNADTEILHGTLENPISDQKEGNAYYSHGKGMTMTFLDDHQKNKPTHPPREDSTFKEQTSGVFRTNFDDEIDQGTQDDKYHKSHEKIILSSTSDMYSDDTLDEQSSDIFSDNDFEDEEDVNFMPNTKIDIERSVDNTSRRGDDVLPASERSDNVRRCKKEDAIPTSHSRLNRNGNVQGDLFCRESCKLANVGTVRDWTKTHQKETEPPTQSSSFTEENSVVLFDSSLAERLKDNECASCNNRTSPGRHDEIEVSSYLIKNDNNLKETDKTKQAPKSDCPDMAVTSHGFDDNISQCGSIQSTSYTKCTESQQLADIDSAEHDQSAKHTKARFAAFRLKLKQTFNHLNLTKRKTGTPNKTGSKDVPRTECDFLPGDENTHKAIEYKELVEDSNPIHTSAKVEENEQNKLLTDMPESNDNDITEPVDVEHVKKDNSGEKVRGELTKVRKGIKYMKKLLKRK